MIDTGAVGMYRRRQFNSANVRGIGCCHKVSMRRPLVLAEETVCRTSWSHALVRYSPNGEKDMNYDDPIYLANIFRNRIKM